MSVFGWRWWDISKTGGLMSVNNVIWPPNEPLEAECGTFDAKEVCRQTGEKPPVYSCHCGYWAFSDPEIAAALPSQGYFRSTKVFGCIEAWGDIVWHENGFRAEWCIPRAVVVLRGRLHPAYEVARFKTMNEMFAVWDTGTGAEDQAMS